MSSIGDPKLRAQSQGWHAGMIGHAHNVRIGDRSQQITYQIVELDVGDKMRGLLVEYRSAQHARETEQHVAAACQTVSFTVGADQLTLDAKCGGLQGDKVDIPESIAAERLAKQPFAKHCLAKHGLMNPRFYEVHLKVNRWRRARK